MLNPKDRDATAEDRDPLDYLEPVADNAIARVLRHGGSKYGRRNYAVLDTEISFNVYLAAIHRHLNALKRGEDVAPDTGLHHLAHIGANVHVVLAAIEAGTLVDDRGPFQTVPELPRANWQDIGGFRSPGWNPDDTTKDS